MDTLLYILCGLAGLLALALLYNYLTKEIIYTAPTKKKKSKHAAGKKPKRFSTRKVKTKGKQ